MIQFARKKEVAMFIDINQLITKLDSKCDSGLTTFDYFLHREGQTKLSGTSFHRVTRFGKDPFEVFSEGI